MSNSYSTFTATFLASLLMPIAAYSDDQGPATDVIEKAITKSLTLIEKSTIEYRNHRKCFSCHHQAMPTLTLSEARRRGFKIDQDNFQKQLDWTAAHLRRGRANYLKGKGQGGKADTAGYALWALEAGGWKADETTAAVAEYLLLKDKDLDHWRRSGNRPPSEASDVTTTAVALLGLRSFAADEQSERVAARQDRMRKWFAKVEMKDTEDRVFRLLALDYLGEEKESIDKAAAELIKSQRDDGGWSQNSKLKSDAYATGSVLVALHQAGGLTVSDPVYQRGLKFLTGTQLDDGSWHVKSRSKPFQKYFESGFPHGKDQFISMTASCWATSALLMACPSIDNDAQARKNPK